jgi:4-alpha-glucanotransferase
MHPTSLPSRAGIGDLGPAAYDFVNWLATAKQTLWQILPLGPPGHGNSPYSCTSAFAGNVLMISLERLADRGLIGREKVEAAPGKDSLADFDSVRAQKLPLLREAAGNFLVSASGKARNHYRSFCRQNAWWLEDYVLFSVLRERFGDEPWSNWPKGIAHRHPDTILKFRKQLDKQLAKERFLQFAFFEQWGALRSHCRKLGVRVIGDVAIFVSYDSADVWTHPKIFRLKEDLSPEVVAGVPPDAFSETGQRWGNPLYNWDELKAHDYEWWVNRMQWATETCDIVRLDHFRGFEAYWEIPADEPTAIHGRWVPGPNEDLFDVLRSKLGDLPLIAEDLGYITPKVTELRRKLGIPGSKVIQFGFGDRGAHKYLPHRFKRNSVVYTGTHDNDTTVGWWNSGATENEKKAASAYLGIGDGEEGVHWTFIRAALTSVANLAVIPMQDVLGLGSDARMNVPSQTTGNWSWRLRSGALTPKLAARLAALVDVTDRDISQEAPSSDAEPGEREVSEDFVA